MLMSRFLKGADIIISVSISSIKDRLHFLRHKKRQSKINLVCLSRNVYNAI